MEIPVTQQLREIMVTQHHGYYGHAAAREIPSRSGLRIFHAAATEIRTQQLRETWSRSSYGKFQSRSNLGLNGMAKCGKGGSIILTYNDGEREKGI